MKNVFKKIILSSIVCALSFLAFSTISNAAYSSAEAGNGLANFANTFIREGNSRNLLYYSRDNRSDGYNMKLATARQKGADGEFYGQERKNVLFYDCSSFVCTMLKEALNIRLGALSTQGLKDSVVNGSNPYIEYVGTSDKVSLQKGDILLWRKSLAGKYNHAAIYLGGSMAHARNVEDNLETNAITWSTKCYVLRVRDNVVDTINTTVVWPGGGSIVIVDPEDPDPDDPNNPDPDDPPEDPDPDFPFIYIETIDKEFYYNGLPTKVEANVTKVTWDLIVEKLSQVVDWILGIMFVGIKAVFVGWINIVEELITKTINFICNTNMEKITLENIIFNKVPIIDINFFNFSMAGGQAISEGSIIYTIRENIALWYNILRTVTIMGLLVTLIYIGIQIAISSVAEKKAKYKSMLVNWLVSFFIVFFIHYFMIIIVKMNEGFLLIFGNFVDNFGPIYENLFTNIHKIELTISWSAAIVYSVLVYYMCKFLFMYIKRFVVLAILTLMAPIIAISYAIDKIKDNKSQSLSKWMKEYVFNVIIQTVHALLFSVFVISALNLVATMKWETAIPNAIISFVCLNFITKAEKIMKDIFGMKADGSSLGDIMSSTIKSLAGVKVVSSIAKTYYNKVLKPISSSTIGKGIDKIRLEAIKNDPKLRAAIGEQMQGATITDINTKIDKVAREELAARKDYNSRVIKSGIGIVLRSAKSIAAVPMAVVNPGAGLTTLFANRNPNHYRLTAIRKATGISRRADGKRYTFVATMATLLTMGAYDELQGKFEYEGQQIAQYYPLEKEQLYKAQNAEVKIKEEKEKLTKKKPEMFETKKVKKVKKIAEVAKGKNKKNATKVETKVVLAPAYKKKLEKNLQDVFRKVPNEISIKQQIEQYKQENKIQTVEFKDLSKIVEQFGFKTTNKFGKDLNAEEIKQMDSEKLAHVINEQLTNKDNIKQHAVLKEFEPIVEQAKLIKEANDEMKQLTGKDIYEDIDKLIKDITNQ